MKRKLLFAENKFGIGVLSFAIAILIAAATAIALPRPSLAASTPSTTAAIASGTAYLQSKPLDMWSIMALAAAGDPPSLASATAAISASVSTSSAIGYEAPILAITAMGQDPRNFNGQNYLVGLENFYSTSTSDLGGGTAANDDIFGLLALSSAGVPSNNPIIVGTRNFLMASTTQDADGGWGYAVGAGSDSNDTAVALMALLATGSHPSDTAIVNGLAYLKSAQNSDGGFTYDPTSIYGTSTDGSSDSWAISAITAAGQSPTAPAWTEGTSTAIASLLSLQNATSGFFEYQPGYNAADSYDTTSYAVIALLGKSLPVATIAAPTSTTPLTVGITPSTLADATAESPYNATITASDADSSDTFTWTVATDTLSSDFILATSSTAGVSITGTPSTIGTYNFSVTAISNASSTSSSTVNYTLNVDAAKIYSGGGGGSGGGNGGTTPVTGVQVSYHIENPSSTTDLCDGNGRAVTALDVLADAAGSCDITYHAQQYTYGSYVDKINTFAAAGTNGWLYLVDGTAPSVAAVNYDVKANDSVVWYFGSENSAPTASTTATATNKLSGSGGTTTNANATTTATTTIAISTSTATSTVAPSVGEVLGASTTTIATATSNAEATLVGLEQELWTLEARVNSCTFQFNKNLRYGMSGTDVQNLQTVLNYIPTGASALPTTGYFGNATEAAAIAFQDMWSNEILAPNGLSSGNGIIGPSTRAVLNELCKS